MDEQMGEGWIANSSEGCNNPSRLDIVKDVFANAVTRIAAHELPTRVGLITFSSNFNINERHNITDNLEHFEKKLDGISTNGRTAIWNALRRAKNLLLTHKLYQPDLKCRIVLLTDGQDNDSDSTPEAVCTELYSNDIVLDAIVIGTSTTANLFRMAKHTGGYAFNPKTRKLLCQIPMLETFIDIRTRPDIVKVPERCIANIMPWAGERPSSAKTFGPGQAVHHEVKAMIENEHDFMDVYVSESNMAFWKVAMQGPPDTPYAGGTFLLYVELGAQFPTVAPKARFITPILHPNVTKHGKVCHAVFGRDWNATTHVYQVLQHLWGMLMTYDTEDSVDPTLTVLAKTNHEAADREIKEYNNVLAYTDGRPDHIPGLVEGVPTIILPFHQLPSIDAASKTVKHFATYSRASIRRDILGVNADDTSSLLSITDLKDNSDTSVDPVITDEKAF